MLSQIFGGMKDEGHSGSARGRREEGGTRQTKLHYEGRTVIISPSPVHGYCYHHTPYQPTPPMLHSETLKCWIFCIPQDHWSCQSLLYMRACVQQLVVCEWTPVHLLYSSGLWRPFYSRPEHNIALPLHHHHNYSQTPPPPPPPRPQCQDDCQANYHYLDCYQTWRYIWPECWLTCNVCSPLSCLLSQWLGSVHQL